MSIVFSDNSDLLMKRQRARIQITNRLLLEQIQAYANPITPMNKTVQLRNNVSKTIDGLSGIITWKVPYASYQNRGRRYDGTHVVKHYTTAGTGKGFADTAVKIVVKKASSIYAKTI
jgi:hypothetical protein